MNKKMRVLLLLSFLFILVLGAAYTYSKYYTEVSGVASADVAEWDIIVNNCKIDRPNESDATCFEQIDNGDGTFDFSNCEPNTTKGELYTTNTRYYFGALIGHYSLNTTSWNLNTNTSLASINFSYLINFDSIVDIVGRNTTVTTTANNVYEATAYR